MKQARDLSLVAIKNVGLLPRPGFGPERCGVAWLCPSRTYSRWVGIDPCGSFILTGTSKFQIHKRCNSPRCLLLHPGEGAGEPALGSREAGLYFTCFQEGTWHHKGPHTGWEAGVQQWPHARQSPAPVWQFPPCFTPLLPFIFSSDWFSCCNTYPRPLL